MNRGNRYLCAGTFSGGEIEGGVFQGGEIPPGTFHTVYFTGAPIVVGQPWEDDPQPVYFAGCGDCGRPERRPVRREPIGEERTVA